jgi:hypothetical protein
MAQGNYVLVENGAVVWGPGEIPRSWKNVVGLNMKDAAGLKALGWLPWREVLVPYDDTTHYRDDYTHDIQADEVIYTDIIRAFTAEQLAQNAWNDWSTEMNESDRLGENPSGPGIKLPRQLEDIVGMMVDKFPGILEELRPDGQTLKYGRMKKRYDDKRTRRSERPPQP